MTDYEVLTGRKVRTVILNSSTGDCFLVVCKAPCVDKADGHSGPVQELYRKVQSDFWLVAVSKRFDPYPQALVRAFEEKNLKEEELI